MGGATVDRNRRLRIRRTRGASIRMLAREFKISTMQVRRVLESTGGDPLRAVTGGNLATLSVIELDRERVRLRDRIASDRRRLREVDDELEVRRTDALLGLTG